MKLRTVCSALWAASLAAANPISRKESNATASVSSYSQTASIADAASTTDTIFSVPQGRYGALFKPKVMVVNMYYKEEDAWIRNLDLMHNISVPLLSPEYPYVHSNDNFTIMSVTTGEGEINAATTIAALCMSPLLDLTETYFLISGIGGGSPQHTTIGSVTFAKYAVQVGLQYQIDSREIPANWTYGYVNFKTSQPNVYPATVYGTEIFELNENLMNRAMHLASNVTLQNGTTGNVSFRQRYNASMAAYGAPKLVACDTATSDVYWSGEILEHAMSDFVTTISNKTATYCSTQQEDNASLESFLRAAKHGLVDYNRIVLTRGISDFDRAPNGLNATEFFFGGKTLQGGATATFTNLYLAGLPFVQDVVANWDTLYKENNFMPKNYIGDYFETLGGVKNFGL